MLSMAVCFQLLVLVVSGAYGLVPGPRDERRLGARVQLVLRPAGPHVHDRRHAQLGLAWRSSSATAVITSYLAAGFRRQRREAEERRRDAELLARDGPVRARSDHGRPARRRGRPRGRRAPSAWSRCAILLGARPEDDGAGAGRTTALTPSADGLHGAPGGRRAACSACSRSVRRCPTPEPRWATPGFATAVAGLAAVAVERGRLIEAALEAEGLRRSDELKTALLHGVSHEFRTPLTAIRTAAHTLSSGDAVSARDTAALLAVMGEETERLDRLVANLLDLSRLEAGALVAHMDWCAPAEMVAGAIDAAAPLLDGAAVRTDVPSDLPLVRADAVLCERILVNLLHNAVRHGAPPIAVAGRVAGGRLEIAVARRRAGHRRRPSPTGCSTPSSSGDAGGGTGVGLALARGLAEAQGATLRAEPARRGGPLRAGLRPRAGAAGRLMAAAAARILVVDDEPQVLRSLTAALDGGRLRGRRRRHRGRGRRGGRAAPARRGGARPAAARRHGRGRLPAPARVDPGADRRRVGGGRGEPEDRGPRRRAPTTTSPSPTPWASCSPACARRCAGPRRRPGESPTVAFGDVSVDMALREVRVRRRGRPPHPARVRAAGRAGAPPGAGHHPPGAAVRGLGAGLLRRDPLPARLHGQPAPQARGRPLAPRAPRHRDRGGVPAASSTASLTAS